MNFMFLLTVLFEVQGTIEIYTSIQLEYLEKWNALLSKSVYLKFYEHRYDRSLVEDNHILQKSLH